MTLPFLAFVNCSGGGGGGGAPVGGAPGKFVSLTEGSFTYSGTLPAKGTVAFVDHDGNTMVTLIGYPGFVEIMVDPATAVATVKAAVLAAGGTIVAQTPMIGDYVIEVTPGNEEDFLVLLNKNSWVLESGPVVSASPGANYVFDWNFGATSNCLKYHGDIVTQIANRRGGAFTMEAVSAHAQVPQSLADLMLRKLEAVPEGENQVISMSIGIDGGDTPQAMAFHQYFFLRRFYAAMEQLHLKNPAVADRNLVSIIAGNTGTVLDSQLAALRKLYPNAFKRIVIVGGVDSTGSMMSRMQYNHISDNTSGNMVYARGTGVKASSTASGSVTCSGTSYAAPEVASVLDALWKRHPGKTAAEILEALRDELAATDGVIPQDADGKTTNAFLDKVSGRLGGVTATPTPTPSPTATPSNVCHLCTFDINCTVFGLGGCYRCRNSTYGSGGTCIGSGLQFNGPCVRNPDLYHTCQ